MSATGKEKHEAAFEVFDRDNNGQINHKDIATVLERLGEKIDEAEIGILINHVDND